MKATQAIGHFHGPERYNCAQAVLKAFQTESGLSDCAVRAADVAVFSNPVYYGDVSGQFKMFFDRTWSHVDVDYAQESPYSSRIPKGKTAIFILTQGDVASKHEDVIERYKMALELYGYDFKVIRAASLMSGRPDEDVSAAQAEAVKLAQSLMSGATA